MMGLFYFGDIFRPVPLQKHFIGVKGKPGSQTSKMNLDKVAYDKVINLVRQGHQVMVFVHARRDTALTARKLYELAMAAGDADLLDCSTERGWDAARIDVGRSKNKEIREFYDNGMSVHHAGMLRSDRNLAERLFGEGLIKVLCCTATLAWGVNLPAYAVVIKGTELYDQSQGKFVDLGVLDVLQVHPTPPHFYVRWDIDGCRSLDEREDLSMRMRESELSARPQINSNTTSPPSPNNTPSNRKWKNA
jgi:antiviral helicase SLH1